MMRSFFKRYLFFLILPALILTACGKSVSLLPHQVSVGEEILLQTDLSLKDAGKMGEALQEALPLYQKLVPFPSKRSRRFKVSVFKDQDAFLRYKNQISSVKSETGFYLPDRGELGVVYRGERATLKTLYHEVFHAFFEDRIIHPPAWLNEGFAEYAEVLPTSFLKNEKPNEEWIRTLHRIQAEKKLPHLRELIEKDWPDRHGLASEEYAISWSLIYFFRTSKAEGVQEGFQKYLRLLYDKKDPKKAFYEIWPDVENLNEAWQDFVRSLSLKRLFLF